jgi:ABC-2 type transport system permease protein
VSKTLLVLRHEILTNVGRKSFLLAALGIPLVAILIVVIVSALRQETSLESPTASAVGELQTEGYIDQAGLIEAIPEDVPPGTFISYPDEASARQALEAGEIAAYYIIPADYVESGDLAYVNPAYNWTSSDGQTDVMERVITASLLGNDPERVQRFWNAMDVQVKPLAPVQERDEDNSSTFSVFSVPYGTMMIFYMTIMMSASLLLNSVTKEKQNRVMEILMVSVRPRELLTGKVIGLGILGLLQVATWLGTAYGLLRLSGRTFSLPPGLEIPPSILVWGLVFFLLGYVIYATLMAGLGALVPNLKEASQATFLVIWPTLIPMFLYPVLLEQPHGLLSVALSLFPLTAPFTMMLRLAAGGVPAWQPPLATVLTLVGAYLVVRAVAAAFHAQNLLSGEPFSAKRFFGVLLGRQRRLPPPA